MKSREQIIIHNISKSELEELITKQLENSNEANNDEEKEEKRWITRKDLKEIFHISYPTIAKLEKEGVLVGYRFRESKRVLYKLREIEDALTKRNF